MSKSEGNFFTVRDIGEKYDLQVLRFFILSAHYRSPLNFSADLMKAAENGYDRIVTSVANLNYLLQTNESDAPDSSETQMTQQETAAAEEAKRFVVKFEEAMEDDFNTADAISAIFELVKFTNTNVTEQSSKAFIKTLKDEILMLSDLCGLIVEKEAEILDDEVEALIQERQEARKEKNFARADEIRGLLLEQGIILEDTREGVKWKRA